MELALGRGGDQVVLKSNDKITYYGGRSQGTEKSTRVKARVKTLAFKELFSEENKLTGIYLITRKHCIYHQSI